MYGSIFRWLLSNMGLFLFVLVLLTLASLVTREWDSDQRGKAELEKLEDRLVEKTRELKAAEKKAPNHQETLLILKKAREYKQICEQALRDTKIKLAELEGGCGIADPICEYLREQSIAKARSSVTEKQTEFDLASVVYSGNKMKAEVESKIFERIAILQDHADDLNSQYDRLRERLDAKPIERTKKYVSKQIHSAIFIVIVIILFPFFLRTFLYYLVARLAQRLKPVNIDAGSGSAVTYGDDKVSIDIEITKEHELLVRQKALQSVSTRSIKGTRFLLNSKLPFTSIASGMYLLTSVRPGDDEPETVTVSLEEDLFSRICCIKLPESSSIVLKPHAIVGVLKRIDANVEIQRRWRLLSLHSWLTFQFRYLVFKGPCEILLQGCRGVRIEQPNERSAKLIDQHATIAFTANLDYSNQRIETFVPYLLAYEPLFKDRFSGKEGVFIYEEAVHPARKSGMFGRGLEGFVDGAMKAFGI